MKNNVSPQRHALMAGSFNPFTAGHHDIVMRGLELFDHITILVGINAQKVNDDPEVMEKAQTRAAQISSLYAHEPRISVIARHGLTAQVAKEIGAGVLLRGVRGVRDFEYERDMADLNHMMAGLETVFLTARPQLAAISSSAVRDIQSYGADVSSLLPPQTQTKKQNL